MSGAADSSRRLQRLAQILADTNAASPSTARDSDAADVHLDRVPLERISRLTSELTHSAGSGVDDVDRVAVQILLNDYTAAVAHLRATVRLTQERIADTSVPIQQSRALIRRRDKARERAGRQTT